MKTLRRFRVLYMVRVSTGRDDPMKARIKLIDISWQTSRAEVPESRSAIASCGDIPLQGQIYQSDRSSLTCVGGLAPRL